MSSHSFMSGNASRPSSLSLEDAAGFKDHDRAVYEWKVRLLYSHGHASNVATLLNALLLVFIQWSVVPHPLALGWAGAMIAVLVYRWTIVLVYNKRIHPRESVKNGEWGRWYVWGAAATGIGWGVAGILFIPESSVPHQFFTVFLLSGMASGAMTVLSPVYIAYALYIVPLVSPMAVLFLTYGDSLHLVAGFMMILFLAFLLKAGRIQDSFVDSSFRLSLEKEDLLKGLALEKEQVESLNEDLKREVAERARAERKLQYLADFESLLTSISTGFINLSPSEMNSGITRALEQIGSFAGVDRAYVFLADESSTKMNKTHEWCDDGIETAYGQFQSLPVEAFPWWVEKLRTSDGIHVPRVEDLPREAVAEKSILQASKVRSVVVVPLSQKHEVVGFVGFSSVKEEKTWDQESISLLKIFAEMLVSALDRKRTEEELERAREKAEAAAMAKAQFLANMSHEIRTPMHGVLGMLTLLRNTDLQTVQRQYASTAYTSAEMLLRIVDDILDLSKIEAGGMALEHTVFDLHRTLEEAVGLSAGKAADKGVALNVSIGGDVPRSVRGDPGRLRQILVNLVDNAVKFTEKGEVTVGVRRDDPHCPGIFLHFEVRDTGIGIPPEVQARLFQPFTQADGSTTRRFGGTGLGLAISKRLVEIMGGSIGVESKAGEGSSFWVHLCLEPSPQDGGTANMEGDVVSESADNPFEDLRVLVVEDNPLNRELVRMMLESFGSIADLAENGREAVDAHQAKDYDIVLMDCQMPVMDGFEATRLIREYERREGKNSAVIIALTAGAMEGDRSQCLEADMNDYLAKPFLAKDFKAVLSRWLPR